MARVGLDILSVRIVDQHVPGVIEDARRDRENPDAAARRVEETGGTGQVRSNAEHLSGVVDLIDETDVQAGEPVIEGEARGKPLPSVGELKPFPMTSP